MNKKPLFKAQQVALMTLQKKRPGLIYDIKKTTKWTEEEKAGKPDGSVSTLNQQLVVASRSVLARSEARKQRVDSRVSRVVPVLFSS